VSHSAEFEEELDLTPLIDVAFLLQIFFMITSTIAMASNIVMPEAKNGQAPNLTKAITMTIYHTESGPELYLADGKGKKGIAQLTDIPAYVQEEIAKGNNLILIKADASVASGYVEDVARAASQVEGIERYLVGVVDKPGSQ
jgi:biopolymer transport protein ExbD